MHRGRKPWKILHSVANPLPATSPQTQPHPQPTAAPPVVQTMSPSPQRPQACHTSHEQPTHVETSARGVSLNANAYPNPTATPTVGCKPVASNFPKNAHPILNF